MSCFKQMLCFGSRATPSTNSQPRPKTTHPPVAAELGRKPTIQAVEDVPSSGQSSNEQAQESPAQAVLSSAVSDQEKPTAQNDSLWTLAFNRLKNDDPALIWHIEDRLPPVSTQAAQSLAHRSQLEKLCIDGRKKLDEEEAQLGRARSTIDKTSRAIIWAQDVLGRALSASPEASLAWACVTLVLPFFTNLSTVDEANKSGFTYVTTRLEYYIAFEPGLERLRQDSGTSTDLVAAMTENSIELYRHILDFQIRSAMRFDRGAIGNMPRDAVDYDGWASRLARVKELESLVERDWQQTTNLVSSQQLVAFKQEATESLSEIQSLTSELVKTAQQQRDLLQEQVDVSRSKEEEKCLQVFRRVADGQGAGYEWYKDRVQRRIEGTCEWFLNHQIFKDWLARDSGPLVVSADPGCGKSVLARYLINEYLPAVQPGSIVCYFFFKDQDQDTITLALCAILHQLLSRHAFLIREHALNLYSRDGESIAQSAHSLWAILAAALEDPRTGPVVLVLDALDECKTVDLGFFIEKLRLLFSGESLPQLVKCLMTTRPYEHITSRFRNMISEEIHIPGEDDSEAIGREVNHVIRHRVASLELSSDRRRSQELRDTLLLKLLGVQHRTYLWVYLMFDYLTTADWKRTKGGMEQAIATLPQSVNEAYEKVLSKANASSSVRKILSIMLGATRPLDLEEMSIVFSIEDTIESYDELEAEHPEDFRRRLRNCCGLFVSIDQGRVYFLHQTAREFLTACVPSSELDTGTSVSFWRGTFSIDDAHILLARLCMTYLYLLESELEVEAAADPKNDALEHPRPMALWRYAADSWKIHVKSSSAEPALASAILRICNPQSYLYDYWFYNAHAKGRRTEKPLLQLTLVACFGFHHALRLLLSQKDYGSRAGQADLAEAIAWSIGSGEAPAAMILLEHAGAGLLRSPHAQTFLRRACWMGLGDVLAVLISRGVSVRFKELPEENSLLGKIFSGSGTKGFKKPGGHLECIKLLLDNGAIYTSGGPAPEGTNRHSQPKTLNSLACISLDTLSIIQLLCRPGFDINQRDCVGVSLLSYAAFRKRLDAAAFLIERGADINTRDIYGRTPLFRIVEDWVLSQQYVDSSFSSEFSQQQQYDRFAEPNITHYRWLHGRSLFVPPYGKDQGRAYRNTLRWVIEHGADLRIGDFDGQLPLDIADAVRDTIPEPSQILREYGA